MAVLEITGAKAQKPQDTYYIHVHTPKYGYKCLGGYTYKEIKELAKQHGYKCTKNTVLEAIYIGIVKPHKLKTLENWELTQVALWHGECGSTGTYQGCLISELNSEYKNTIQKLQALK